jgi:hypothetical protein
VDRVKSRTLLAGFAALLVSALVHATTVVITTTRDATLIQDPNAELALGAAYNIYAGRVGENSGGTLRRGLLYFNTSVIPVGSVITSVQLKLNMSATQGGTFTVGVHRCLLSWGEGTSFAFGGGGATPTAGDATWVNRFFPGTPWPVAGGSYSTTASATKSVGAVGWYVWGSTPQLVADVQNWVDQPSGNLGWALIGNETTLQSVKRFDARESGATTQPQLIVIYTEPPANPADINGDGSVGAGDLTILLSAWGTAHAASDIDNDGIVAASDLTMLFAAWGT